MTLTPPELRGALLHILKTKDSQALWTWIWNASGVKLPHRSFTHGHSTPFAFVADAFFNPGKDVAAWANRSGIKTLGASLLALLEYTAYDGLQGRVLSGSEDQAKNLYGYWRQWCDGPLEWRVAGDVKRFETNVGGGLFQILAASQKKVRGGKVQRLYEDELDEIDPEIDEAAVGMIASRDEMPARTVYTSTWHRAGGPMGKLVEACPGNGVTLHRWNLWESIERCLAERHDEGRGCRSCPLQETCVKQAQDFHTDASRAIGVAAEATGLYRIEDACKAVQKVSKGTWNSEYLCKRPSVDGLVFPEFDSITHKCESPPADLTLYRVIDWGHTVFCCLWIGEDKTGRAYVLDTYRAEAGTIAQHAKYINDHPLQAVRATYCDPAGRNKNDQTGRSNIELFRAAGIRCEYTLNPKLRNVQNGIQMVQAMLQPASGPPRMFYVPTPTNRIFVTAMQSYHNRKVNGLWINEPQDPQEYEHLPDALRYFVVNRQAPRGITSKQLGAS